MSKLTQSIFLMFILLCLITPALAADYNITVQNRTYWSEDTAVPFELFALLIILGVVFLGASFAVSSPVHIIILSILGMAFLAASAFAAPVVGFFNYESFTSTNLTSGNVSLNFVPSVSLIAQPWVSWLLWGAFLIGLVNIGVRGVGGFMMDAGNKKDEWER